MTFWGLQTPTIDSCLQLMSCLSGPFHTCIRDPHCINRSPYNVVQKLQTDNLVSTKRTKMVWSGRYFLSSAIYENTFAARGSAAVPAGEARNVPQTTYSWTWCLYFLSERCRGSTQHATWARLEITTFIYNKKIFCSYPYLAFCYHIYTTYCIKYLINKDFY